MEAVVDRRGRPRVQTVNEMPSKTVQSDAKNADIRHILGKYKEVGVLQSLARTEAQFADVSEFTDYADLMRTVRSAEVEFMKLPANVRAMFDNDVAKYLDAAHDQEKRDALVQEQAGEVAPAGDSGAVGGAGGESPKA